ncbi:MAG: hypothetical protein OS130_07805 [Thermodesulfobacteriota bacterium]|nr:MAG: hypothetical protein OS130_07805 [Thermodesulfobacteriota bacterium]
MTEVNSGTHFWDNRFKVPFEQANPQTIEEVRRILYEHAGVQ